MNKDFEKEVREQWFKDHKATTVETGTSNDTPIIMDWNKAGTCIFYVRYVFDRHCLYISGDLGEAVFVFSENANPERLSRYSLDYFHGKLKAFSRPRWDFNQDKAKTYLKERRQESLDSDEATNLTAYDELLRMVDDCSTTKEWELQLSSFDLNRIRDGWEWIPTIGDEISKTVQAYWIGLKMVAEQAEVKP